MNDTTLSSELPNLILAQTPVLLASLAGLIVALRLRRKAPAASLWAAGAFALGIVTCGLVGLGQAVRSDATTHFIAPVLRAVTYVLLLIGVYAGRPGLSATPASPGESVWQNVASTIRARPGLFSLFLAPAVSVFLVVVITATLITFILPESFVSTAWIKLMSLPPNPTGATSRQGATDIFDPRFMQSECEVIQSEGILGKAIDDLDLNKEWGKKYANGDRLKTSESMALLKARMDVRPVRNTSVIEIRTYSERPQEAAKIANSLALAYLEHWSHAAPEASGSSGVRVDLLDHAVPGKSPIRPNKPLNIALGVVIGLVMGLLVGAGAWWVGLQAGKNPGAQPRS